MANDQGRGGSDGAGGPDGTGRRPDDGNQQESAATHQDPHTPPDAEPQAPRLTKPAAPRPAEEWSAPPLPPVPPGPGPYGGHPGGPYGGYPGPYDPGPYPGPQQGPAGWGQPGLGAWLPPAAPKPGVIPLRPLELGDILGGTFAALGRCWKALLGISLIAYGGAIVTLVLVAGVAYLIVGDHLHAVIDRPIGDKPLWSDTLPLIVAGIVVWVLALIAMLVASSMVFAVCPAALQDAVLGRPSAFGTVWRRTMARVPAVLGTGLLTALIVAVPFALFFGLALTLSIVSITDDTGPGPVIALWFLGLLALLPLVAWLWVRFSLAPAVVVFETAGPVTALRRSARLVQGAWWRIFGISALVYLIAAVAGYVIQIPFNMIGAFSTMPGISSAGADPEPAELFAVMGVFMLFILLGALVSQLVTALFPQLALGLLYVDQRIRKERLDVTLAEAAGVPLLAVPPPYPAAPPYGP